MIGYDYSIWKLHLNALWGEYFRIYKNQYILEKYRF